MVSSEWQTSPFFIVGCARSGTTLLQTLLDNHSNIAIPPESHIYDRFAPIFHTYGDFANPCNRRRFIDDLLRDVRIRGWLLGATPRDVEERISGNSTVGIIEGLFSLYVERHGARRWGDKTPRHIRHLRDIRRHFPDAKLIHLVRDGRDVAEAMRRMIWGPISAVGLAQEWRSEVMQWQSFCAEAGTSDTLVVRYEDLVTSPQIVIEEILYFIEEPFSDTTSTYMDSPLSQALGEEGPWHSSLRQGIRTDKIGAYRKELTPREIEIFESIAGDALTVFGYKADYASPRAPTLRELGKARIMDPVARWSRKLRRPEAFWVDLQYRLRNAYRLLRGAPGE